MDVHGICSQFLQAYEPFDTSNMSMERAQGIPIIFQAFHLDGVSVIYSPGGPGDATFTCFEQRYFKSHRKAVSIAVCCSTQGQSFVTCAPSIQCDVPGRCTESKY